MKYFVMSDVHGFYDEMLKSLLKSGFDANDESHKIILCGDFFDRGNQALQMQNFIVKMLERKKIILIRGNHEDLMFDLIEHVDMYADHIGYSHHASNGTLSTARQLTGITNEKIAGNPKELTRRMRKTPWYKVILPACIDYFETKNYIFVHGWIPCYGMKVYGRYHSSLLDAYCYDKNWRSASAKEWSIARWANGIDLAMCREVLEPGKTIVCGHYHCSYGHFLYGDAIDDFNKEYANFTPFKSEGIIAIDACTAHTKTVNCIVIEDDNI